jgi:Spy/CpxP family protein refolding chaperone
MFGFFIGSACVAGLAMMAARRHHAFHRHGFGGHGCHGRGGGFGRQGRRGGFGRRMLYSVLDRLDTSPGQDKAILAAIDDLSDSAHHARRDLPDLRKQVASAMRAESFDEQAFTAIFDEPLGRLNTLRDELTKSAATIHETLTPKQRERLYDLVQSSTRWGYGYAF